MPTIKFPKNPNIDTAFVEQEGGTKNRALMTAPQDISTLEYPNNPNSTKGYITVDGKKQRVILTADITGGGSSLPDQTGHSGEFLTTDGTDASWSDKPLVNTATGYRSIGVETSSTVTYTNCTIIGYGATTTGNHGTAFGDASKAANCGVSLGSTAISSGQFSTAVGYTAKATKAYSVSFGCGAETTAVGAIQVGYGTNNEVGTLYVGLVKSSSPWDQTNYKLLDSDGTIPTARLTKVNSTITLTAAGWSSNTQTVTVTGMTTTGVVWVSPDPTDQAAYTSAGILCTAQAADSLTFTCSTTPSADIDVNVVML